MTQDMNRLLANNPQLQNVMSNPEARLVMVEQLTKQFEDMFRNRKINKPKYLDALRWAQQIREQAFVDKQRMQETMHRPGPSPWVNGQGPMGHQGPMQGPSPWANGPLGQQGPQGPQGSIQGTPGQMQGPQGPMQGPPGQMQGPPGQMQGPPGPMQGPPGPMQGPPGPMPGPHGAMAGPPGQSFNNQSRVCRDLPLASPQELDQIAADPVKRIDIDQQMQEIRYYGETAVIITGPEADDMKELVFRAEDPKYPRNRKVVIDGRFAIDVELGAKNNTEFQLGDGVTHTLKIGAPTRELWIDGQWHELFFD